MSNFNVIEIADVSKRFVIHKDKSLKERVVNFGRSQKHREDFWALRNVDLSIASGTTVGLIGPNGSGKSTLLKMIGGILQPTTGEVRFRGRLAALLELGAGFHPDLTGRENVFLNASILGLTRKQTEKAFDSIVDFSGIEDFIDTQVKFYSSGMYVRLAFAVATNVDPDILLVDEVLAVGDEPFQRKCLGQIRQFQSEGRTIILVTHGLEQVAEFCDRAIVLDKGSVVVDGTPREGLRALREDFEETRQEDIERQRHLASDSKTPQPRARFTGFSLASTSQTGGHVRLADREPLEVLFEIQADDPVPDARINLGVATATGAGLYSVTSQDLDIKVDLATGTHRYTLRLTDLSLAHGEYVIQATLCDAIGRDLHVVPEGASFFITTPSVGNGVVRANAVLLER